MHAVFLCVFCSLRSGRGISPFTTFLGSPLAAMPLCCISITMRSDPLHYHDGTRADDAVEGGKQGGVMAGQLAALALQPVLTAAGSALKESGGFATAIIDDGYLLGPTKALVAVLTEYKKNLKAIGGSLNEDKSAALLGAKCELPADFPVPSFLIEIRSIKFNLASRAYQTKSSPLEGLARPRALPRPPPYGAVERSGPPVRGPLPCRRAQS